VGAQERAGGDIVVKLEIQPVYDAAYLALGAPHPGGLLAQIACEERRRKSLVPRVLIGIAAAAHVEQQRRAAG